MYVRNGGLCFFGVKKYLQRSLVIKKKIKKKIQNKNSSKVWFSLNYRYKEALLEYFISFYFFSPSPLTLTP